MPHYALASHVFVCLQDEHVVFLDVRKDRYFALEAAQTRGLGMLVSGWPVQTHLDPGRCDHASSPAIVELLVARGLLTVDTLAGKDATPIDCEAPIHEVVADAGGRAPSIGVTATRRFLTAALVASLALRFRSFESVIRTECRRREKGRRRHGETQRRAPSLDLTRAHELIAVFAALRPYFFTAKDACLFETLALGRFLASYGIYPQWIFGVQARPFAAHCWLQRDGIVLNDTVEHVTRYTPIMSV